jgi:hypothetical protein
VTLLVHALIALALLGSATVLAWHKTIDSQAYVAIVGVVTGLVGGSAGTLALVGFNQPPPNSVKTQTIETTDPPAGPPPVQPTPPLA